MYKTLELQNVPYASSGAMGMMGNGWTPLHSLYYQIAPEMIPFLKTMTFNGRRGHPLYRALRILPGGNCVNAVSHPNAGYRMHLYRDVPQLERDAILSLFADNPTEMREMVKTLNFIDLHAPDMILRVKAIQIVLSCPNVDRPSSMLEILKVASGVCRPVVAKIGPEEAQFEAVAEASHQGFIQGVVATNSVPWHLVYPGKISPLLRLTGLEGGVSGPIIKPFGLDLVRRLRRELPSSSQLFGGGGIEHSNDVLEYEEAGADFTVIGKTLTQSPLRAVPLLWWYHNRFSART